MDGFCQQKLSLIFQNTRFFLSWCNLVFSLRPGFYWTLLKRLFVFEPSGVQRCLSLNLQGRSAKTRRRFYFSQVLRDFGVRWCPALFSSFVCLWLGVVHMVSRLSKQSLRCCVDSGDALWTSNLTKHMSNFSDRFLGCLNEMYCAPASIAFSPLFFWSGCLDVFELMWGLQPAPASTFSDQALQWQFVLDLTSFKKLEYCIVGSLQPVWTRLYTYGCGGDFSLE